MIEKTELAQMAPPVTLSGLIVFGITLEEWVLVLSLFLLVLQICWFLWDKLIRPRWGKKNGRRK